MAQRGRPPKNAPAVAERPRQTRSPQKPPKPIPQETLESVEEFEDRRPDPIPDLGELEAEDRLAYFHEHFGEKDYQVRIELFNISENDWEVIDKVKLDGFDSFNSLKKFGGGRYRLSLLNDRGLYVAGGRTEVRVAQVAAEAAKAQAQPQGGMNDSLMLLIESLKATNAQNLEIIRAALGRPVPEQKGPSLTELISALSGLKGLTPKEDNGMGGIEKTLGLFKLVKEILPDHAPAEDSGSGVMGEIAQAVKVAGEMGLLNRGGRGPRQNPQAPAPAAPTNHAAGTVVVPEVVNAPEPESPMKPVIEKLQSYVPTFVSWAKREKDIQDAADFLVDELDNEVVPLIVKHYKPGGVITLSRDIVWGDLLSKAKDPLQLQAIFTAVPDLAPHRVWVEAVIAEAVRIVESPEETEETENATTDAA